MRLRGHIRRRLIALALGLACFGAGHAIAAPATPFDVSLLPRTTALWSDGADRLAAASATGEVRLLDRDHGASLTVGTIGEPATAIAGRGAGASFALAVCGRDGAAGRLVDGTWERSHPVTVGRASFVGAAIDAHDQVWCAADDHALYVWHDHLWERLSYPSYGTHVSSFALGTDGQLLLTGPDAALLTLPPSGQTLAPPPEALARRLRGSFPAIAWSESRRAFWLAGSTRGLHLADLTHQSVQRFDDVPTGTPRRLTVAGLDGLDLVAITDGQRITLFQDGATRVLEQAVARPHVLVIDPRAGHLYISTTDALAAVSLAPHLQHGATSADRRLIAGPSATSRAGDSARLRGGGMLLRTAIGPMWKVAPTHADAAFSLDLVLRFPFTYSGQGAGFVFWPAVGYTYEDTTHSGHLATLGLGLGYGDHVFTVAWVPRFVIGDPDGALAAGWRHGLYGELLWGIFHIELAHQILWPGGDARHDLRLHFGVDLLAVARVFGVFSSLSWMGAL